MILTKIDGSTIEDPSSPQIKQAYLELFRQQGGSGRISLFTLEELELTIYQQTIVLQDYGNYHYDGPGGPGELLMIRFKESTILPILEKIVDLMGDPGNTDELIKLLRTLPAPTT